MLINTKDFDYVEISENDIIAFPQGIYGFEDTKAFVLLNNPDNQWMMHLQSVSDVNSRLILLDPIMFIDGYDPVLPEGTLGSLQAADLSDICFFVVAVIPNEIKNSTVNLKSPVAVNFTKKIGAQVILENKDYTTKTRMFAAEGTDESC